MTTENLLESVLSRLDASKGRHKEIASGAGVDYSTLSKIVQRSTTNPGVLTIQRLADYFKADDLRSTERAA